MKIRTQMSSVIVQALVIAGLVFGLAPLAEVQTLAAKGKPATAKAKSPTGAKPSGGPQEGIKVHGHWTIEVRNPDGSLVSRTEFENALAGGEYVLRDLLTRRAVAGLWEIMLWDLQLMTGPCDPGTGLPRPCLIVEAGGAPQPNRFPNLIMTQSSTPPGVQLSGTATAKYAYSLFDVSTIQHYCQDPNTSPVACTSTAVGSGPGGLTFTNHRLQNPINVVPGQIIQVTVVISFS